MLTEEEIRSKLIQWESVYDSIKDRMNKTRVEGFIKGLKFILGEPLDMAGINRVKKK